MFWTSVVVVVFVGALLIFGIVRRRGSQPEPGTESSEGPSVRRWEGRLLLFGGVVGPLLILFALWLFTLRDLDFQAAGLRSASLRVDVQGRLWWWDVRYPAKGVVTANEIHIPVGRRVLLRLTTNGVIHSFWVPQLAGKTDMISGRTTEMWLQADRPGVYRGQCAEYCGRQHAHMIFSVIADPPARFDAWLAEQSQVPQPPTSPQLQRGRTVLETNACAGCHTVRGTAANGTVGPDLTHFGSRRTIGAGTVPNRRGFLGAWIVDSQLIKPGNLMPPLQMSSQDLDALIAYLESLR